jgi:bifunctional ADP-heptose synthase (sugar kinase/adenylyltransferase)
VLRPVNGDRLQEIIRSFAESRIAVLGDYFLDKYLDVDPALAELSVETGKTAHQVVGIRCSPGAAGTVVNNLAALGAGQLYVLGFTGDDGEGFELRRALRNLGCNIDGLFTLPHLFTPTYLKPRDCRNSDLSGEHERYDTKNRRPTLKKDLEKLLACLGQLLPSLDALIVLDQVEEDECGVVTAEVRERLATMASLHPDKIFWTDSRRRIGRFRGVIIKPNAHEAIKETFPDCVGREDDEIMRRAILELRQRTGRPVFVTAGRRGIWISDPEPALVRGVRVEEPTDPTGAGDSATAGAVLALCARAALEEAALVANLVASITVQQLATTGTAKPEQLGPRLEVWRGQG